MASIIAYLRKSYFQFVVYGTSNKLNVYVCSKKCMPWKGDQLEIANFSFSLFCFHPRISLTAALTNMKLGREMKLCDPTNIGMSKSM